MLPCQWTRQKGSPAAALDPCGGSPTAGPAQKEVFAVETGQASAPGQ